MPLTERQPPGTKGWIIRVYASSRSGLIKDTHGTQYWFRLSDLIPKCPEGYLPQVGEVVYFQINKGAKRARATKIHRYDLDPTVSLNAP